METTNDNHERVQQLSTQQFYTPTDVARLLTVSPASVRRWLRNGDMTGGRLGGRWRVNKNDLIDFVEWKAIFATEE